MSELIGKRRAKTNLNKLEALKARLALRLAPAKVRTARRPEQSPA